MTRIRRLLLGHVLLVAGLLFASPGMAQDAAQQQRDLVNGGTVGVISGGVTGTYIRITADLADALDDGYGMRILPVIGKGSVRNVEDLLYLRGIDVAIVQSDVLDFYRRAGTVPAIDDKIRYIAKLYNEEVHLLARTGVDSIRALEGRRVNFGTEGSGTFMTASLVFDEVGVGVDVTTFPEPEALSRLLDGDIDALVFVGGQPLALLTGIPPDAPVHLLPIPAEGVEAAYLETTLDASSYPNLIAPGSEVPTLAVGAVMAAYNWPSDHPRHRKVERFVDRFFQSFDELQQPPYHAKWQEVDLGADVPGWHRMGPAKAALGTR